MYLHNLTETRIKNSKIHNKSGELVDSKVLIDEYRAIKNYLISNYTNKDIVAINFDKDYRYLLTILAAISVGITFIPLNKEWPEKRIGQIVELSGCFVIKEEDIDFSKIEDSSEHFENEILYIIFTSGTTGIPKGVKIKREAYVNFLQWSDDYFKDINNSDRVLLTTDFTFDIFWVDVSLFLAKNLSLYISDFRNNVFKMLYEIERYQITTHSTVPYNYSMIMSDEVYEKANLSSLKHIMLGGARFPNNLYYAFKERLPNCNIYNFYGPTEATIYCSIHKLSFDEDIDLHNNNVTIGKPFRGNEFIVVDEELLIGGKQLMQEYLNNPEKTKEVIVDIEGKRYYKSGDVVFKDKRENYFIVGRKDDTIKTVGYRVNLSDIDSYILTLDYISNVATIAVDNQEGENDLIAYIILNSKDKVSTKEIKKDLREFMPSYQIPKQIKIVDKFPLNNSGKICKKTLKNNFLEKEI